MHLPHSIVIGDFVEALWNSEITPFSGQLHTQICQDLFCPISGEYECFSNEVERCHTTHMAERIPKRQALHHVMIELISSGLESHVIGEHNLHDDVASSSYGIPLFQCRFGNAATDLLNVIEDEVIGVFHRTINRLSVTLDEIKVAGYCVGSFWELPGEDGVSIDGSGDLAIPTLMNPVALEVEVEMFFGAIANVTVGSTGRADDNGGIWRKHES